MGLALLDAPDTDSVPECAGEGASRITVRPEYADEEPEPRREKGVRTCLYAVMRVRTVDYNQRLGA